MWRYIPTAQATEDWEQNWEKDHPGESEGMATRPCYEYRFSNAARLIFAADLPTAILMGSPQGCPESALGLALTGVKPRVRVRTGAILLANFIVLGILAQWWLIGRWLDYLRTQSKPRRRWIIPIAVITVGAMVMVPTAFGQQGAAEFVNILSGMIVLLAWIVLIVMFVVVGTASVIKRIRHRLPQPVSPRP